MSRQKTVRHQPRQYIRPSQDASKSSQVFAKPRQHTPRQPIFLLQRYTPLLWLATLAILIGSATAAVMSIVDPDASVPYGATFANTQLAPEPPTHQSPTLDSNSVSTNPVPPQPRVEQPSKQTKHTDTASPLSAGGALLLSCATGCLLLSQWLKPNTSRRVSRRSRSTRRAHQVPTQSPCQLQVPSSPAVLNLPEAKPQVQPLPLAAQSSFVLSNSQPRQQETSPTPATEVSITIVPVDQSHPLDWDEPSLADSLDLRQRRPLSYWLHR
jgi:hypothetical protein